MNVYAHTSPRYIPRLQLSTLQVCLHTDAQVVFLQIKYDQIPDAVMKQFSHSK